MASRLQVRLLGPRPCAGPTLQLLELLDQTRAARALVFLYNCPKRHLVAKAEGLQLHDVRTITSF